MRRVSVVAIILVLSVSLLGMLGAVPRQGVPPQPFYPDYFSGRVSVQGKPAPAGTQLVACVEDCVRLFQSAAVKVEREGKYANLVVNPSDQALRGRSITFYLVNEFGRIRAVETATFEAGLSFKTLNLTFNDPVPTPTPVPTATPRPTPSLPVVGDTTVTRVPKLALGLGGVVALGSVFLLLVLRRRAF